MGLKKYNTDNPDEEDYDKIPIGVFRAEAPVILRPEEGTEKSVIDIEKLDVEVFQARATIEVEFEAPVTEREEIEDKAHKELRESAREIDNSTPLSADTEFLELFDYVKVEEIEREEI